MAKLTCFRGFNILLVISILLIVIGGVLIGVAEGKYKTTDKTDIDKNKQYNTFIITGGVLLGIGLLMLLIGILYYYNRVNNFTKYPCYADNEVKDKSLCKCLGLRTNAPEPRKPLPVPFIVES